MTEAPTQEMPLPVKFERYIGDEQRQVALAEALPRHISVTRMSRLAMLAFNNSEALQRCHPASIFESLLVAATVGLEIGVDGQGYLVPYKGVCTFVPGWKGIVDIVSRSGKATVWTGAVYQGDEFDFALGSAPFVTHKPMRSGKKDRELEWAYAIGSITGSPDKVIEVWSREQLEEHFNANVVPKLREKHYRWKHEEMYFRKVPLLQVCKYMPKSIELTNALTAAYAAESGDQAKVDKGTIYVERVDEETGEIDATPPQDAGIRRPERRQRQAESAAVQDVQEKAAPSFAPNTTNGSSDLPATDGERNYVIRKAGAGLDLLMADANVRDIKTLTKTEFLRCKQLLAGVAA